MKAHIKIALLFIPAISLAQAPVDEYGDIIGPYESQADIMPIGDDGIPRLSYAELQELVGPIALYPDELLAVVLPASSYPLQIVEAARFLEALELDSTLKPDPDWDDSVVALINYPEVVELLNTDLDWTWRLGDAVVAQQTDVIAAVETFRDRAYAAGNLKSDSYQTVANEEGVIRISPSAEDVIYVPYYEPTRVVHYQSRPAYFYYPRPCPVYYYPYAANHYFDRGNFWGVTTAFSIGWASDSLSVYHHSYRGHPYYGRTYWNDGWYRNPSINVYNTTYVDNTNVTVNRYSSGDQWRAGGSRREFVRREGYSRTVDRSQNRTVVKTRQQEPVKFRQRDSGPAAQPAVSTSHETLARQARREEPGFRTRKSSLQEPVTQSRKTRRQEPVVQSRNTKNPEPVIQSRDARRDAPAINFRDSQSRKPVRQTYEAAQTGNNRAAELLQRNQPENRQRSSTSQATESRSRPSRSSSESKSDRSKPKPNKSRRQNRERD